MAVNVTFKNVRCVKNDGKTWSFTKGKMYRVITDVMDNDHRVYDETGLPLYLVQYGDQIVGAGVDGFEFKGVE